MEQFAQVGKGTARFEPNRLAAGVNITAASAPFRLSTRGLSHLSLKNCVQNYC